MLSFAKNIIIIILFLLISLTITSCMVKEYYHINPVGFDDYGTSDVFSRIKTNAFIAYPVDRGDIYMDMWIKNAQQFKTIYIKEISCQINNTTIFLLKDKSYEIDYISTTLGKIEKMDLKKLLKNIGKDNIELPIVQEYILDGGDLIHEEYVCLFEYKRRVVSFFEK